jgi:hypothetical protein
MRVLEFTRVDKIVIPFEFLQETVKMGLCHTIISQANIFLLQVDTLGQYLG